MAVSPVIQPPEPARRSPGRSPIRPSLLPPFRSCMMPDISYHLRKIMARLFRETEAGMYNCAVSERNLSIIFAEKGHGKLIRWLGIICSAGLPEPRSCPGVSPRRRLAHFIARSYPVQPIIRFWMAAMDRKKCPPIVHAAIALEGEYCRIAHGTDVCQEFFQKFLNNFLRRWKYY